MLKQSTEHEVIIGDKNTLRSTNEINAVLQKNRKCNKTLKHDFDGCCSETMNMLIQLNGVLDNNSN